jgi:hypothetical protein
MTVVQAGWYQFTITTANWNEGTSTRQLNLNVWAAGQIPPTLPLVQYMYFSSIPMDISYPINIQLQAGQSIGVSLVSGDATLGILTIVQVEFLHS